MAEVYYFGCDGQAGHHLRATSGWRTLSSHDAQRLRVPADHALDGGAAFLPYPEKKGVGALTYCPANDLTVLAWWGNPWDERGAVNNAVMVRGQHDFDSLWSAFEKAFPNIAPKLSKPTIRPPDRTAT